MVEKRWWTRQTAEFEAFVQQVLVVGAYLVGEEHALVDDRARRHRHDVEAVVLPSRLLEDPSRDHLADDEELPLVFGVGEDGRVPADEDLPVAGLGGGDLGRLREGGIVDRHVAEADQRLAFRGDDIGNHLLDVGALSRILRHEQVPDGIVAGLRQGDALPGHLLRKEAMRDLHEHARSVAHQRIGADGAAVRQVLQHGEAVEHDLVRLVALQMRNKADAARIVLVARIVEPLSDRQAPGLYCSLTRRAAGRRRGALRCHGWRVMRHRPCLLSSASNGSLSFRRLAEIRRPCPGPDRRRLLRDPAESRGLGGIRTAVPAAPLRLRPVGLPVRRAGPIYRNRRNLQDRLPE